MICPGEPQQRSPNAPKFEDRSQEETERQELNARDAAWKMARCIMKLKEKHKTTFFSPSENWCPPSPSTIKPEKKRICCGLWCVDVHDQQKGLEFRCIGNRTTKNWIYFWQWKSSRICQQFYRWESFAMKTETHVSGQTVKNHISSKMVFEYSVIRKTSYQWWFLVYRRVLPQICFLQHPWHV